MQTDLKTCSKCNIEKPLTIEYFYFRPDRNYFRTECICCKSEIDKKYNFENKNKRKQYDDIRRLNPNRKQYELNKSKERYLNKKTEILEYAKKWRIDNGYTNNSGQTIPEKQIELFLIENNIKYIKEKWFENCRSMKKSPLFFDFYLTDKNILLEYDGKSHFEPIFGENQLILQKENDELKNKYCIKNNIILYRITYLDNLNEKLEDLRYA